MNWVNALSMVTNWEPEQIAKAANHASIHNLIDPVRFLLCEVFRNLFCCQVAGCGRTNDQG